MAPDDPANADTSLVGEDVSFFSSADLCSAARSLYRFRSKDAVLAMSYPNDLTGVDDAEAPTLAPFFLLLDLAPASSPKLNTYPSRMLALFKPAVIVPMSTSSLSSSSSSSSLAMDRRMASTSGFVDAARLLLPLPLAWDRADDRLVVRLCDDDGVLYGLLAADEDPSRSAKSSSSSSSSSSTFRRVGLLPLLLFLRVLLP